MFQAICLPRLAIDSDIRDFVFAEVTRTDGGRSVITEQALRKCWIEFCLGKFQRYGLLKESWTKTWKWAQ